MDIIISPRAEKELKRIGKIDQIALVNKIGNLSSSQLINEKLKGYTNIFRVRVGNYRIVYRKLKNEIYIILIGHRKDIYQKVQQLLT